MKVVLCVLLFLTVSPLSCREDQRIFYVLKNREGAGMFSMFSDVLALVYSYEKGVFRGIEVDYGSEGLYYDQNHGPNWWNYYCEPICFGERKNVREQVYSNALGISPRFFFKDREEAYHLIQKYIHFLPHIVEKVEQFKQRYFQDHFVIGLHFRGTDAPASSPPFEIYKREVEKLIRSLSLNDYRIFIASDELPFIDYISAAFPGCVCYQPNALRSGRNGAPLHFNNSYNHYLQGEEALIDCILLSNCSHMMLAYSNLSLWAALLNPFVPMNDLSGKMYSKIK